MKIKISTKRQKHSGEQKKRKKDTLLFNEFNSIHYSFRLLLFFNEPLSWKKKTFIVITVVVDGVDIFFQIIRKNHPIGKKNYSEN